MMYRIAVILLLSILIGLVAWDVSARKASPEARVNSPNFAWEKCPSCERMFYVEKGHRQGWCPYDGLQFDFSATE